MKTATALASVASGLAFIALPAGAAEEFVQHGSHVHGEALLNVVIDGSDVVLELETPAANLVGFEHAPKNAEQKAAIESAVASLEDGNALFQWPAGGMCRLMTAEVDSSLLDGHGDKHGDDHDGHHDDDHHDEHHDEHDGKDHHGEDHHGDEHAKEDDDHGHDDHGGEVHSEFRAEYRYRCRQANKLDKLDVNLFETFPGVEELKVQYIANDAQGAAELTASKNVVQF